MLGGSHLVTGSDEKSDKTLLEDLHMQVRFAHLRERSNSGGWINFVVFATDAMNTSNAGRQQLLAQLVARAGPQLRIDQAALAFQEGGRTKYFGSPNLVDFLSKNGVSRWTHSIDV